MIKCPNCGSTAQVKIVSNPIRRGDWLQENSVCGCGQKFVVWYDVFSDKKFVETT